MQMLAFGCLAIVWAAFLVPPIMRRRHEGRPASSVHNFRRQLSTLERATPGTMLSPTRAPMATRSAPGVGPRPAQRAVRTGSSAVIKRRRDVFNVLLGATAISFMVFVLFAGLLTFLLLAATAGALGAYCYVLVQIRMRAEDAAAKVRVLRPHTPRATTFAVRQTANG